MKFKKPFFIAEISANHNGNFNKAIKLIKLAKDSGADAVKLQTYTADSMTLKSNKKYFKITKGLWKGYKLWDLYNKAKTPYSWHERLFVYAKKINIKIFSTPFDENAVDFLEKLKCPFYKVASFEMLDFSLIKKIARTNKPIIISTGMSSLKEIEASYRIAKYHGARKITLLYCVSNYPSKISDFNLYNIKIMKRKFNCEIGFSDHSNDSRIAAIAVKMGATVVEKHIKLKNVKSLDYDFSIDVVNLKNFKHLINNRKIENQKFFSKIIGKKNFYRNRSENDSKLFRRSIFISKNIKKGSKFNKNNIKRVRPGHGISPVYYDQILGQKSNFNLKANQPLLKKNLVGCDINLKKKL